MRKMIFESAVWQKRIDQTKFSTNVDRSADLMLSDALSKSLDCEPDLHIDSRVSHNLGVVRCGDP